MNTSKQTATCRKTAFKFSNGIKNGQSKDDTTTGGTTTNTTTTVVSILPTCPTTTGWK